MGIAAVAWRSIKPARRRDEFHGSGGGNEHYLNFFEAVRSRDRAQLNAEVVVGHDSTNWSHVINAAWRSASESGLIPAGNVQASSPLGASRN